MKYSRAKKPFNFSQAFTLVEMLIVVAIIGLLIALSTPYMASAMQAGRLTSAGEELAYKISLAQQASVSENRAIEMRFYSYLDPLTGDMACRAYQLYLAETPTIPAKAYENAITFADGDVVITSGVLSPMIAPAALGTGWPKSATQAEEPFFSRNATYISIIFKPDGGTNILAPLGSSYLTLVGKGDLTNSTGGTAPPNFFTIQIDPITGRARTYRP